MQSPLHRQPDTRPILTPRNTLAAASAYVGTPYLAHGRSAAGWDCWGCVAHIRREIFGLPSPDGGDLYHALEARDGAKVEALFAAQIATAWREVPLRPGSVLLFEVFGHAAHVGLALTPREFIHALEGTETAILRLSDRWAGRLRGIYDTYDGDPEP